MVKQSKHLRRTGYYKPVNYAHRGSWSDRVQAENSIRYFRQSKIFYCKRQINKLKFFRTVITTELQKAASSSATF